MMPKHLFTPHAAFGLVHAALAAVMTVATHSATARSCTANSGAQRLPLVELYTSEGCSSCPPADHQLAELGRGAWGAAAPLALHVNFWDHLGWRDPYAQASFTERQRRLIEANGSRTLYTPHFFVSGREVRDRSQVAQAMKRVSVMSADWKLTLQARATGSGTWALSAGATPSGAAGAVDLILTTTEDGLASKVRSGENAGELLRHAHVVRHWWQSSGSAAHPPNLQAELVLSREQVDKGLDLVVFIQDRKTSEVLQAVRLTGCIWG